MTTRPMRALRAWLTRFAGLFGRRNGDLELTDELNGHLDANIEDNIRAGMSPDEARRSALLTLGGVEMTKERYREQRGIQFIDVFIRDVRYGFRVLLKNPAFALAGILILGLGIGANTAIFSLVNAVILRPLPFRDSARIMRVWQTPPETFFVPAGDRRIFVVSPANYLDWEAQNHVFDRMALYRFRRFNITGQGEPDALRTAVVTGEFFNILGVQPLAGRTLGAADQAPDAPRTVLLRESVWRTRFGGDPAAIGRTIALNGEPYTIVGVVPQRTAFPENVDLWLPLVWTPEERVVRSNHTYFVMGHLRPGVDVKTAQAEMTTISQRLERQYPEDDKGWGAFVVPLHEDIVGDVRLPLLLLLGAVVFVVLIGSANLANLLLAKTLGRSRELAVRTALGASRLRVIQQVLTETLLLAAGGTVLGLVAGWFSLRLLSTSVAEFLPRLGEVNLDARVLLFTCTVAVAAAVLAGIVPAWRLTRTNPNDALKQGIGRTSAAPAERRVRNALVVCEVALALVLLTGAGLLLRTLMELRAVDAGFDPRNLLTMNVGLPRGGDKGEERVAFINEVLRNVRALPGVESAAAGDSLPFQGGSNLPFAIEGQPRPPLSQQPIVPTRIMTPGFVQATRMRLIAGRDFSEVDRVDRELTVIISQAMARKFWPNQDPIGQRISFGLIPSTPRTVVGIVNDVKLLGLSVKEPVAAAYLPVMQLVGAGPFQFMALVVRTNTPADTLAPTVVKAIHGLNADLPVRDVQTMDSLVDESIGQQRFALTLISTFAGLAVLLAAIGIYSVLSYSVGQRISEIGIRRALGAPAATLVRTVVGDGLKPALAGIVMGLAAATALGQVMTTLLFGVGPHDALTLMGVSVAVVLIALLAAVVPAYRATRINPLQALRTE
jgi:putative ABC transport system permease protein